MTDKPKYQSRFEDEIRQAAKSLQMEAVIYIDEYGIRMEVTSKDENLIHKESLSQFDLIAALRKAIQKITPSEEKND